MIEQDEKGLFISQNIHSQGFNIMLWYSKNCKLIKQSFIRIYNILLSNKLVHSISNEFPQNMAATFLLKYGLDLNNKFQIENESISKGRYLIRIPFHLWLTQPAPKGVVWGEGGVHPLIERGGDLYTHFYLEPKTPKVLVWVYPFRKRQTYHLFHRSIKMTICVN